MKNEYTTCNVDGLIPHRYSLVKGPIKLPETQCRGLNPYGTIPNQFQLGKDVPKYPAMPYSVTKAHIRL